MEEEERKRERERTNRTKAVIPQKEWCALYKATSYDSNSSYRQFWIGYFQYRFSFLEPESHFIVDGIYRYGLHKALKETTKVAMPS